MFRTEGEAEFLGLFGGVAGAFVSEPFVGSAGSFAVTKVVFVIGEIGLSGADDVGSGGRLKEVGIDDFGKAVVEVDDVAVALR